MNLLIAALSEIPAYQLLVSLQHWSRCAFFYLRTARALRTSTTVNFHNAAQRSCRTASAEFICTIYLCALICAYCVLKKFACITCMYYFSHRTVTRCSFTARNIARGLNGRQLGTMWVCVLFWLSTTSWMVIPSRQSKAQELGAIESQAQVAEPRYRVGDGQRSDTLQELHVPEARTGWQDGESAWVSNLEVAPALEGARGATGAGGAAKVPLKAYWNNGLQLESDDRAFRMHVGGRLHADFGWWLAEDQVEAAPGGVGPLRDGANYRRARVRLSGTVYDSLEWVTEYGFENGVPAFFDTYGEFTHLPGLGNLRIGHFREPFSLDALTSGNHLLLMERNLLHDAFVPFRNVGLMTHRTWCQDAVTTAIGFFRGNSDLFGRDADDGSYAITGRVTWNPWYDEDAQEAVHLGFSWSTRNPPTLNSAGAPVLSGGQRAVRLATRPEIRINAPNFADTGTIPAEHLDLFAVEWGWSFRSWFVQSEYMWAVVSDASIGGVPEDLLFHGFYVQTSYVLTGQHRRYIRRTGVFGTVSPVEPFRALPNGEPLVVQAMHQGAWEVAVRYSWLDLNDGPVHGARVANTTFGLNWYVNPQSRLMWNYILIFRDPAVSSAEGWASVLAMRFQIDF
jgi:phosphate-selective porin OprO/OprP